MRTRQTITIALALVVTIAASAAGQTAPAATLDMTDVTLGVSSGGTGAFTMRRGHQVAATITGSTGSSVILFGSATPPPANPPVINGVPLAVDLASLVIFLDGFANPGPVIGPTGSFTQNAVVPPGIPLGSQLWLQAAVVDIATLTVQLTNGLVLTADGEPLTTIDQGIISAHPLAASAAGGFTVISDAAAWSTFWAAHHGFAFPPPPLPTVDFTTDVVLAVFTGFRPTGGYSLNIDAVSFTGTAFTADATETQPGSGCVLIQILTNPYHIVSFPAGAALPVLGVTTTIQTVNCP